ncbi:MAG: hypothetical protein D6814_10500 [Calditrichaeota bacterium]|nr:MAG: hypothetical protein D6814_10500 [Calditrichota bacterium]
MPATLFSGEPANPNFYLIEHWYPQMGVFEDEGWLYPRARAVNRYQHDFGTYDVRITLPKRFQVAATGERQQVIRTDSTQTWVFHADPVNDFAWAADTHFRFFEEKWQSLSLRLFLQPQHVHQKERLLVILKAALKYYREKVGAYPYPVLTLVDARAGTTEHQIPTLMVLRLPYWLPEGIRTLEAAVVRQLGQQYWHAVVAANEAEEPWLEGGFTRYFQMRILDDFFAPEAGLADYMGFHISGLAYQKAGYWLAEKRASAVWPGWHNRGLSNERARPSRRAAMLLATLENILGQELWQQILRTYFERWKFNHPTTRDFIEIVNKISARDWSEFFDQALYSTRTMDYAVTGLQTRRAPVPGQASSRVLRIKASAPVEVEAQTPSRPIVILPDSGELNARTTFYRTDLQVQRLGEFIFPAEMMIRFADGYEQHLRWKGKAARKNITLYYPAPAQHAVLDPDHKNLLDINVLNNSRTVSPQWGDKNFLFRCLFWIQNTLQLVTSLN